MTDVITKPAKLRKLLTASSMACYRQCPRKYQYQYVLRFRSLFPSDALSFGTIMHKCWEHYWLARKSGLSNDHRMVAAFDALPEVSDTFDAYKRAKAEAMLVGYCSVWDMREDIEVIAVEKLFRLPLANPESGVRSRVWDLGGKLDVIVRINGRICIIEHKSSSEDIEEGSVYRQRLMLDGQVSQYFEGGDEAVRELGIAEEVEEIIYDISAKPKMRPAMATPEEDRKYTQESSKACKECNRKRDPQPPPHIDEKTGIPCSNGRVITDPGGRLYANMRDVDESPDEYFDRVSKDIADNMNDYFQQLTVVRLGIEREEYLWDVFQTGEMIKESIRMGRFPKNPSNCFQHHAPCDYWAVCTRMRSIHDDRFYRIAEEENEELVEQNSTEQNNTGAP